MALHIISTAEPNILQSMIGGADLDVSSVTSKKFKVFHDDGSYTVFRGSGIVLDWFADDGGTNAGQITSLYHYDSSGILIDRITGFDLPTSQIDYAIHHGFWLYGPLSGDDVIRSSPTDLLLAIDDVILSGLGNDTIYAGAGNDEVDGSFGNDILIGQDGNDTLRGDTDTFQAGTWLNGNDTLIGGTGDDSLYGGMGGDDLRGGLGDDTAIYDQSFAQLTIKRIAGGFQVTTSDGVDTLKGVEHIQASDNTYCWDSVQRIWVPEFILA